MVEVLIEPGPRHVRVVRFSQFSGARNGSRTWGVGKRMGMVHALLGRF